MKTLLLLLAASTAAYASNWFLEPTGGLVIPQSSGISYHGMNGKVQYSDGFSAGLNAGRQFKNFKLYFSYDYNEFRAKSISLQTPIGSISNNDSDLFHTHTVLFNADYARSFYRWETFVGVGAGASIDESISTAYELHLGIAKRLSKGCKVSLYYSYRFNDGQFKEGKKSDGTYSITGDKANQGRLIAALSFNF